MKTCGLDVHKDTIFCAIYDGKKSVVRKFDTFTPDLEEMCDYIMSEGVDTVAMESTGIHQCGSDSSEAARNEGGGGQSVPDKADAGTQERCEGLGVDSHADV